MHLQVSLLLSLLSAGDWIRNAIFSKPWGLKTMRAFELKSRLNLRKCPEPEDAPPCKELRKRADTALSQHLSSTSTLVDGKSDWPELTQNHQQAACRALDLAQDLEPDDLLLHSLEAGRYPWHVLTRIRRTTYLKSRKLMLFGQRSKSPTQIETGMDATLKGQRTWCSFPPASIHPPHRLWRLIPPR
jgi:hypothetical protein